MISLHRPFLVSAVLAVALCSATWPLMAEEPPSGATSSGATAAESTAAEATAAESTAATDSEPRIYFGGLRIVVDPETGRIVSEPPRKSLAGFALDPVLLPRLDTSAAGLVQEAGPQGGVMVDLQGRFSSATVAVIDDDGNLRMDHVSLASEEVDAPDPAASEDDDSGEESSHDAP